MVDLVGQTVRRITFSLYKDGVYYVILSVVEYILPTMQDFPCIKEKKFVRYRATHSVAHNNQDKIYFTIDYPTVSEKFLNNPTDNYIVNGCQFKFLSSNFSKSPLKDSNYWLIPENIDADILKCFPARSCPKVLNCLIDNSGIAEKTILSNRHYIRQLAQISSDHYGVDLSKYTIFLGNIYFLRYFPYFKTIDWSMTVDTPGIVASFDLWKPSDENLFIELTNKNNAGLIEYKVVKKIELSNIYHFIELPDIPSRLDIKITDQHGNIVYVYEDMVFIHNINVNMNIRLKSVKLLKQDGSSEIIDKFNTESTSLVEDNIKKDVLSISSTNILLDQLEQSLTFVTFDGLPENKEKNRDKAKLIVRKIISSAHKRCIIADPYFNLRGLVEFIFSMPQNYVAVKVLSSIQFLADKYDAKKNKATHLKEAVSISDALKNYTSKVGCCPIYFRLLKGKSPLHDRYIVADDTVWVIGTSLDEIGIRFSSIYKLPSVSGSQIIKQLEHLWSNKNISISVEEYVATSTDND